MTTASGTELLLRRTEFDDWRSLTIGIYMALAGYAVMVGLPVISSSWVNHLGFTEEQVGYVASADLFGLAIGAVIAYFVVARFDRRMLTFVSAGVAIAANLLCIFYQSYEVTLWLRLAAGTGAGVYTGIAVATIGGHSRPAFAFGMELFAFAGSPTARSMSKSASRSKAANTIPSTATCRLMCPGWCSRRLC
jgi:MFS family permease